ncbi:MAG: cell division protein FtsQ/DivIB [Actinomycetota bacterium]
MVRTADRVVRSPRIAARRREVRAQRARRRRRTVLAVLLLAGIGYGAWMLTRTSVFSLEKIDVVGAKTIPVSQIVDASGLHVGQTALGINLHRVADRVRAIPDVQDVRVTRVGSIEIRIEIVERTAAIEVRSGSAQWFLDQQGGPMAEPASNVRLPVILLTPPADVTTVTPASVTDVLAVWAKMPADMRARVTSFSFLPDRSITFDLAGTTVVFGSTDQIPEKLLAVQLVARRVKADHHRLVRVDVRAPSRPAARVS